MLRLSSKLWLQRRRYHHRCPLSLFPEESEAILTSFTYALLTHSHRDGPITRQVFIKSKVQLEEIYENASPVFIPLLLPEQRTINLSSQQLHQQRYCKMASDQITSAHISCPRPDCRTTLSRASDIQRHIRDIHDIEKWCCPYPSCKYRGSKRRDNVAAHIVKRHLERGNDLQPNETSIIRS